MSTITIASLRAFIAEFTDGDEQTDVVIQVGASHGVVSEMSIASQQCNPSKLYLFAQESHDEGDGAD